MASRAIVVMVLLAGCGASTGSWSSGEPLECGPVVSNLFARSSSFVVQVWGDQLPELSKQLADLVARLAPVVERSCRDDRWSVELLACVDRLRVTDDPHKCNHLFTIDQAVGLGRRMTAVIMQRPRDVPR
jgi:hypothetical protein